MAQEIHNVALIFDTDTGKLLMVNPLVIGGRKPVSGDEIGDPEKENAIQISALANKYLRLHAFAYDWSSPGCVTYQTEAGPIRICW